MNQIHALLGSGCCTLCSRPDPRTAAYLAHRRAKGLSDRDSVRCLKRRIANEIFRALTLPLPETPARTLLRRRRQELEIPSRLSPQPSGPLTNEWADSKSVPAATSNSSRKHTRRPAKSAHPKPLDNPGASNRRDGTISKLICVTYAMLAEASD